MTTLPREGFGLLRQTETCFCSPKVISWRSKPWRRPIKERKRYIHFAGKLRAKPRTLSEAMNAERSRKHCSTLHRLQYTVLQHSWRCSASSDVLNRDLNPVLAEKGVVVYGKRRSYSSFAFSCSRTPMTRMSFPNAAENMATAKRSDNPEFG